MRGLILAAVAMAAMAAAGCNTVEGAGRDISAAGQAVSQTAQDAK